MASNLVGSQVPDFLLSPVGGGADITLHALIQKEGKPVVLDIYAEW